MIAMLIEDMVLELGYEVAGTVARLEEALQAAAGSFDLAILDVNLGGVASYPVADVLRRRGIPFAFVTGYGTAGIDATYAGAPVLQKPFTGADFAAVLSALARQEG